VKKIIARVGAVCGILSGIGMICGAILEDRMPKFLWLPIAVGYLLLTASILISYFAEKKKRESLQTQSDKSTKKREDA